MESFRERGFTLVEVAVSLAVTLTLLLAVLAVLEGGGRVSRLETETAAMRQGQRASHRILARDLRMAGRGGLPARVPGGADPAHRSPAVAVRNDVGAGGSPVAVAPGHAASPTAVPGTDVLAVRGVFDTPLYQVAPGNTSFSLAADRRSGTVTVRRLSPSGVEQDLAPLAAAVDGDRPQALVLLSPLGSRVYTVVELVPGLSSHDADQAVLAFRATGSALAAAYGALTPSPGTVPTGLEAVASLGLLEERRYYVRDARPPRLSVADVYPNSDVPVAGDDANLRRDVADGIADLQIALGFDSTVGGAFAQDADNDGDDDRILESDDGRDDDWLFNGVADDPTAVPWTGGPTPPRLYYVRVSTVGRTATRERDYRAPPLADVEDHVYDEASVPADETHRRERMFRRSLLTTVVDLRNL